MSHHSMDSLAEGGMVVGCASACKVKLLINTISSINFVLLINFFIRYFPAGSMALRRDAIELLWVAGGDGVGGLKGSIRVESIGEQRCPVYQRRGHVGRGQNDIAAVRPAVRAAKNKTVSRHRDAVDDRLRRQSNH